MILYFPVYVVTNALGMVILDTGYMRHFRAHPSQAEGSSCWLRVSGRSRRLE